MVRFGIGIPQVQPEPQADVAALHRFLRRAEDLGYESAWVLEQPVGSARVLELTAVLAHAAAVTSRMRLGTAVILLPLRVPVELAKTLATVDQLSGGRLIAGIALGAWKDRYPAFGLSAEGRVRRFEEAVQLLKRLWTEPSVTLDGEFWKLEAAAVEPKPVQQPHPPLWFGGTAAQTRQRIRLRQRPHGDARGTGGGAAGPRGLLGGQTSLRRGGRGSRTSPFTPA